MVREIVHAVQRSDKLGVVDSQLSSVRSQVEHETAVRIYDGGRIGVASAVGAVSLDALTQRARDALVFEIPYAPEPAGPRSLAAGHDGQRRSLEALVAFAEAILGTLRVEFPGFVFSQGIEQSRVEWQIDSDRGLDLSYGRDTTEVMLVVKEKGSPNIIDTAITLSSGALDETSVLAHCREHLSAFRTRLGAPPAGRQRVIFAGLEGHRGGNLLQLFRSDLLARPYSRGASVFAGKLGERLFDPRVTVVDSRDSAALRVCPFDMEGEVRAAPDLPLISEGVLRNVVAARRDAERFGLPATGSAVGELGNIPSTGTGRLRLRPTTDRLVDLLDGEAGVMVWFVAGGDVTRAGDLALPGQVLLRVEPDGRISGRYDGGTLTGNLYALFGDDLIGVTTARIDPSSEEPWVGAWMTVQG